MRKVNVDEIKVGDLIGFDSYAYEGQVSVGYVTRIEAKKDYKQIWGHFGNSPMPGREKFLNDYSVDYHWKVINFEEEAKMDELKVYTGKDTIEALLEGKTIKREITNIEYKFEDGKLAWRDKDNWLSSSLSVDTLLTSNFTEVATPQVGDWVRVTIMGKHTYVAQITSVVDDRMYAQWCKTDDGYFKFSDVDWEILSPEQVSEYKREQAFAKVGRKLNEFRSDDFALINSTSEVAVVVSNNNDESVRLHVLNQGGKGYTAKPHQLTPIYFKDNQVSL
ncbi:Uncharacterised protein [Streptococcus pneumoniae]|nr:Uncharacterised protein [Streptococcus pneumoniae]